jgi:alpha-D-ribose 1-methylphosphonate 5-triphosphate diphosphatase
VTFPYDSALFDVDRQLLANGITTEFHGVTLSWEGGLRGEAYAERMFDALERMRYLMGARHYVHLRFETHHVGGLDIAQQWIRDGRVRFLALNDHLPSMARRLGDERKLMQYANRAECDLDVFQDRIRAAMAAADSVADAMRELTGCAQEAGLKVASHDDPDAATRRYYHQLGCGVAEFPLTREAAGVARDLGDSVVFGAPNVVRGGSHTGAPSATEMVRAGLCDILTSDYYYPAPLAAVMKLANDGVLPLAQAWDLVSLNPARAAGLKDRGALAPGLIADAIVVDDQVPGLPRVCAAIVGGELRYATRAFDDSHSQRMAA